MKEPNHPKHMTAEFEKDLLRSSNLSLWFCPSVHSENIYCFSDEILASVVLVLSVLPPLFNSWTYQIFNDIILVSGVMDWCMFLVSVSFLTFSPTCCFKLPFCNLYKVLLNTHIKGANVTCISVLFCKAEVNQSELKERTKTQLQPFS